MRALLDGLRDFREVDDCFDMYGQVFAQGGHEVSTGKDDCSLTCPCCQGSGEHSTNDKRDTYACGTCQGHGFFDIHVPAYPVDRYWKKAAV